MIKKLFRNSSRGQAIVMIAIAFVGLIAMVGLMIDGGTLLVSYAALKRGVDSASIGAAQEFRKNYLQADMTNAAAEFLQINQTNVIPSSIHTDTCATLPSDPVLCTTPLRKLVRVTASETVTFGFLKVIGIPSTVITDSAVAEAASVDLIMVIDTSISMAAATSGNPNTIDPGDDPTACNPGNTCQPMADVKTEAQAFADKLYYPYDRVAIVALTSQTAGGNRDPIMVWPLQSTGDGPTDQANVDAAITGLKVYQPHTCSYSYVPPSGSWAGGCYLSTSNGDFPCLAYPPASGDMTCSNGPTFSAQECPDYRLPYPPASPSTDATTCNSTNGGGGLLLAGSEFVDAPGGERKNSFWAVVALFTRAPNSSWPWSGDAGHPNGYCPSIYWPGNEPLCIQPRMDWTTQSDPTRNGQGNANYTSLDYARDMADYVTDPVNGQGASIFSICLGNSCENSSTYTGTADAAEPEEFLKYAALTAGGANANHGNYYYSPGVGNLTGIFQDIYNNITTRIAE